MRILSLLLGVFWLIFLAYWVISAFGMKKNANGSGRRWGVRILTLAVALLLIRFHAFDGLSAYHFAASTEFVLGVIGIILCGAGIALAIWARMHIGKNWGMPMSVKEEPELVMSGPYAYVRHPIYSGALLAMLGSALVGGIGWFAPLVIFAAYFVYSATIEEGIMMKEFPKQYSEYKKRTKMLVPFVF